MLIKTSRTVVFAGHPAVAYRPATVTCPPPPQTPRAVEKTVCGTVETYTFLVYLPDQLGGTARVTETRYVLPGFPTVTTISGGPAYTSTTIVPGTVQLVKSAPYCKTVTVYE